MNSPEQATDAQLRRAAGSKSLEKLVASIDTGWTVDEINRMGEADNTKTAMHMAAWKGCIENVKYLVELGCDVNVISTGEFSYGKTPIFFALTRSRNDVVDYLLDQGAFVKIVNNKGQSVLSIAASHLSNEVISKIQDKESEQVDPWLNFRATHSDGFEYGDLDPRFLDRPLRSEDVVTAIVVNPTTKATRKGGFERRNPEAPTVKVPPKPKPKKQINSSLSGKEIVELENSWESLISSFSGGTELNGSSNLLRIVQLCDKQRRSWIPEASTRLASVDLKKIEDLVDRTSSLASVREAELLEKLITRLKLPEDGYTEPSISCPSSIARRNPRHRDKPSLKSHPWCEMCELVADLSISHLEQEGRILTPPNSETWVDSVQMLEKVVVSLASCRLVAVDTEWYDLNATKTSIATLQIAYLGGADVEVFVIDLIPSDNRYRRIVRQIIRDLFHEDKLLLGFSFGNDIPKLEEYMQESLPRNFMDLQPILSSDASSVLGLKACAARFSHVPLSKEQQCSDWSQRPLTKAQLDYATLDAAILLFLLAEQSRIENSAQ